MQKNVKCKCSLHFKCCWLHISSHPKSQPQLYWFEPFWSLHYLPVSHRQLKTGLNWSGSKQLYWIQAVLTVESCVYTLLLIWLLGHSSVQLCKNLTEKKDQGNEIRGKIRVPLSTCVYYCFKCMQLHPSICNLLIRWRLYTLLCQFQPPLCL